MYRAEFLAGAPKRPVLVASCQMQAFDARRGAFVISDRRFTYADTGFLGTGRAECPVDREETETTLVERSCAPAALEPQLEKLHAQISGGRSFRNETAWNFGITLLDARKWRAAEMGRRRDRWFAANEHFGLFSTNSVNFGLGLAYLFLAGAVECWPPRTVLDGLGYLDRNDLTANGIGDNEMEARTRTMGLAP